jgi:DNA-binding response OmpR family regulator
VPKAKVLLIEDDESLAHAVRLELEHAGYEVTVRADGRAGLVTAENGSWDLVLLDLMLPGLPGTEVCRVLRQADFPAPIIMLTARHATADKVNGLDLGADDYVTKPFAMDELLARMRACRRRTGADEPGGVLTCGALCLDPGQRRVTLEGALVELTRREFDLLECLLRHKNQVLSRDRLLEEVWGYDFEGDEGVVDVYVRYLRAKLEGPSRPRLIHTVRGVGFVLREGSV